MPSILSVFLFMELSVLRRCTVGMDIYFNLKFVFIDKVFILPMTSCGGAVMNVLMYAEVPVVSWHR